jgi:hypothetical protein
MSALIVRFTRLNPTHHRFEAVRADGTRDVRELETRSLLTHDLMRVRQHSSTASGRFARIHGHIPAELTADPVARATERFRLLSNGAQRRSGRRWR